MNEYDLDLGCDHLLAWIWGGEHNQNFHPDVEVLDNHRPIGAILMHPIEGRERRCRSAVPFDLRESPPAGFRWTVESWYPLTLSDPVLCHCGDHGRITEGRWTAING